MNLQTLTQAHVSPARIQEYLDQHFERVVILHARNSDHGHAFAAVALDADDQPRLAVLFHWDGCWQYTIHAPSELSEIHLYADDE